ncbi:hypothetical protein MRB53_042298 [Persea americana]|nr:hypothetical protein MRB53_042298 [Persea americana]
MVIARIHVEYVTPRLVINLLFALNIGPIQYANSLSTVHLRYDEICKVPNDSWKKSGVPSFSTPPIVEAPTDSKAAATGPVVDDTKSKTAPTQEKPAAQLEEDDEFEDFPVEGEISDDGDESAY